MFATKTFFGRSPHRDYFEHIGHPGRWVTSLLHVFKAVTNGHVGIVELLLARGARSDITNNSGSTPLDIAMLMGHEDVVRILEEHSEPASKQP